MQLANNRDINDSLQKTLNTKSLYDMYLEFWTKEKRDEYRRSKEQSSSKTNKVVDKGKDRSRSRDRDRSQSPKREFTPEETAAYLERKAKREKKGGGELIMIFY